MRQSNQETLIEKLDKINQSIDLFKRTFDDKNVKIASLQILLHDQREELRIMRASLHGYMLLASKLSRPKDYNCYELFDIDIKTYDLQRLIDHAIAHSSELEPPPTPDVASGEPGGV